MDKIWHRGVIKYLQRKVLTLQKSILLLGDDTPGLSTVQDRTKSLEDDPKSGWPATATTPEIIDHVYQRVMADR